MLITPERPAALQPQVSRTLQGKQSRRREGEGTGASQEEFSSAELKGEDERGL